jgi:hypothetical protein
MYGGAILVHEGAEFCEWKSELFSVHWIGKIKVFWYDDFARRRNSILAAKSADCAIYPKLGLLCLPLSTRAPTITPNPALMGGRESHG